MDIENLSTSPPYVVLVLGSEDLVLGIDIILLKLYKIVHVNCSDSLLICSSPFCFLSNIIFRGGALSLKLGT